MESITIILLLLIAAETSFLVFVNRSKISNPLLKTGYPVYVDTSVLMDGRILTAAATGFVPSNLVVPKSVVNELQLLADMADADKRARARAGLDAITALQALPYVDVTILDDGTIGDGGVDAQLIRLAKKYSGAICTIDYNLNKVAQVEKIQVYNINELAKNLRMAFLPGETVSLQLVQKGQDSHQAVGYLPDGTMVVVEQAAKQIGDEIEVEFIRSLQTAAGRMMFAKKVDNDEPQKVQRKPHNAPKQNKVKQFRRKQSGATKEENLLELVNRQD